MKVTVASTPFPGMSVNGDTYLSKEWGSMCLLGLIDGLGHGDEAALASQAAKKHVLENFDESLDVLIEGVHLALKSSRGAVGALVKVDMSSRVLQFCGVGNVDSRIISEPSMQPVSMPGILGFNFRKARVFEYTFSRLDAVLLHSDGISARFDSRSYPELLTRPKETLAKILEEHASAYDDATILIALWGGGSE
jgi:serine/threonine protein phosphatase PrpC